MSDLALDPIACVGHGLCAELFPEGVLLDDWGFPILLEGAHDPALEGHARRAVRACPALALRLRARSGAAARDGRGRPSPSGGGA